MLEHNMMLILLLLLCVLEANSTDTDRAGWNENLWTWNGEPVDKVTKNQQFFVIQFTLQEKTGRIIPGSATLFGGSVVVDPNVLQSLNNMVPDLNQYGNVESDREEEQIIGLYTYQIAKIAAVRVGPFKFTQWLYVKQNVHICESATVNLRNGLQMKMKCSVEIAERTSNADYYADGYTLGTPFNSIYTFRVVEKRKNLILVSICKDQKVLIRRTGDRVVEGQMFCQATDGRGRQRRELRINDFFVD